MEGDKELSTQEKAIARLASNDIQAFITNGSVYVHVGYDMQLEISEFEVNYQAERYDEENEDELTILRD
jgi:hypothetical protein